MASDGIVFDGGVEIGQRAVEIALADKGVAAVVVGQRKGGIDTDRRVIVGHGAIEIALEGVDAAAVGIGAGIGRIEPDRLVEIGQRGIKLALFGQAVAAVAIGCREPVAGFRSGIDDGRAGRSPVSSGADGRADAGIPGLSPCGGSRRRHARASSAAPSSETVRPAQIRICAISLHAPLPWSQVCIGGFTRLNDQTGIVFGIRYGAASVRDNKAQSRFELDVEGAVAFANYRLTPSAVDHHPHRNAARVARPRHRLRAGQGRAGTDPRRRTQGDRRLRICGGLSAQASGICGSDGIAIPSVIPGRRKASNPES